MVSSAHLNGLSPPKFLTYTTHRRVPRPQFRSVGSLDVVHRDPQLSLVFAAVVDADDVFVVQARGQVGLSVETLAEFPVRGQIAGQDLEGIAAGQPRMLSQIHMTHPAGSQSPNDGVSGEHLSVFEAFGWTVAVRHVSMLLTPRHCQPDNRGGRPGGGGAWSGAV
jgi:hypothetical protein